ncbi:tetratricopeptide repeat protein [Novilysobacter spongiicola]|uniref:Tetratricopeptide repeat-containing protein n=1 Tax=Lysobacter spongiicola DSM 21749 TaxID=1122188 RepID=A0A1T4N9E1_9GAMM|nr:tetratricopeptide repeat protein [Lysobacter spongiicola]SJZ75864.1 Tetratricopeptide repeat-containing protein [Lysobacter spongiicola DSM 21749]
MNTNTTSRRPKGAFIALFAAAAWFALAGTAWAGEPAIDAVKKALRTPDTEAAVAAGERAIAALPKSAEAWHRAGQAYGRMAIEVNMLRKASWATKARDAWQRAANLDPDHLGAREGLVQFYSMAPGFMGGGKDKAAAEIASYAGRNPAGGHYLRAFTLEGSAAIRELRSAVRLDPRQPLYSRGLAVMLDRNERPDEALAALEAGLKHSPKDARLLYLLGRHAAMHDVRTGEGEAALDRIITGSAEATEEVSLGGAHWRRGQLREKRGEHAAATADFRRAVALAPDLDDARRDLDRLLARRK